MLLTFAMNSGCEIVGFPHSGNRSDRRTAASSRTQGKCMNPTIGEDRRRNPIGRHAACDGAAFLRLQLVRMIPLSQDA
jgi:hypothetical protein